MFVCLHAVLTQIEALSRGQFLVLSSKIHTPPSLIRLFYFRPLHTCSNRCRARSQETRDNILCALNVQNDQTTHSIRSPQNLTNSPLLATYKMPPIAPACCYPVPDATLFVILPCKPSLSELQVTKSSDLHLSECHCILCPAMKTIFNFYKAHSQETTLWSLSRIQG